MERLGWAEELGSLLVRTLSLDGSGFQVWSARILVIPTRCTIPQLMFGNRDNTERLWLLQTLQRDRVRRGVGEMTRFNIAVHSIAPLPGRCEVPV